MTKPHTDLWQRTYHHFQNDNAPVLQMRICHMAKAAGTISFGVYAYSAEESSFKEVFSKFEMLECQWKAHDGQPPD